MPDYSYTRSFASVADAQPILSEAANQIGASIFTMNIATIADGDRLVFLDNDAGPPAKIAVAVTLEELQSGRWQEVFLTRALNASFAVYVSTL